MNEDWEWLEIVGTWLVIGAVLVLTIVAGGVKLSRPCTGGMA